MIFTAEEIANNLSYCPVPVVVGAGLGLVLRFVLGTIVSGAVVGIIKFLSRPLAIIGLIGVLTYYPEAIQWIFVKIGEIELKIFAMLLSVAMPDIFGGVSTEYDSWAGLFNSALSVIPSEILEVCQSLDVAGLMGMVTSTLTVGGTIVLTKRILLRGGIL